MSRPPKSAADRAQYRRFLEAARELATKDNRAAFEARLCKILNIRDGLSGATKKFNASDVSRAFPPIMGRDLG